MFAPMKSTYQIRAGKHEDLRHAHALVYELAVYEREPEAVTATLEDYERDFAEKVFDFVVAEAADGRIVGIALYYMAYSTWKGKMLYLEDFVVAESFRGDGIGQALFEAVLEAAKSAGARLLKWQVLDWNEPALAFYAKNNALIEKDWWNGKLFIE